METASDPTEPAPAGFWVRFAAVLVDLLVFILVEILLTFTAGVIWGPHIADVPLFAVTVSVFMFAYGTAYYVILHAVCGQTVGKMLMRAQVVELDGRPLRFESAVLRSFGYAISALTFGIGFLLAGLRRDKRALHDLIAGTRVIRLAPERTETKRAGYPGTEGVHSAGSNPSASDPGAIVA